jgi:peroxiredoxin
MALSLGQKIPAVTLLDSDKNKINLSDFEGKNLVILFFPLAFSGHCAKELCMVRDNITAYNALNTAVVGISVDSHYSLDKFKQEQQINFPLLSDFNKTASTAFDVLYEEFPAFGMKGVSKRSAFVADKTGTLRYAEICPTPGDLPDFEAISKLIASLG